MHVRTPCPNCGKKLRVDEEYISQRVKCPHCRTGFEVEESKVERTHGFQAVPARSQQATTGIRSIYRDLEGASQSRGTNASLLLTGVCAVLGTAVFYAAVIFPLNFTRFGKLFLDNSWVPFAIVLLAAWCTSILVVKVKKLARQRESLLFDVLPMELSTRIRPEDTKRFMRHIRDLPCHYKQNFMLNRVYRALDNYRARGKVSEVSALLEAQGEIDSNNVQSSYTILRVCIWAIPILGFIGTVMGIGGAVGGFSDSLQGVEDLAKIKEELGAVTQNLGMAFNTTFLALVVSLLVMFPTSAVEKAEEDLLIAVDEYCNESLLGRLRESKQENSKGSDDIKTAVTEALGRQQDHLKGWVAQLESLGTTVTEQVSEGWQDVHQQLHQDQQENLRQLNVILETMGQERTAFVDQVKAVQDHHVGQVGTMLSSAGESAQQIQQQLNTLQAGQLQNFKDVVASLAGDLRGLQGECSSHYRQEAEVLRSMVDQFMERLSQTQGKVDALHTKTGANLQDATSEQRQTVAHLDRIAKALADQAQALETRIQQADASHQTDARDMRAALEHQREAMSRASDEQLSETLNALNKLVGTMVSSQKQYSKDMVTSATVQRKLVAHLEKLAKSNSLGERLTHIEQGLDRLSTEVGKSAEAAAPPNGDQVRRRPFGLFKRGDHRG